MNILEKILLNVLYPHVIYLGYMGPLGCAAHSESSLWQFPESDTHSHLKFWNWTVLFDENGYEHDKWLQNCLTLCDPMDCTSPSSSAHGILQVKILECAAISFSRGPCWPRDWPHVSVSPALASGFLPLGASFYLCTMLFIVLAMLGLPCCLGFPRVAESRATLQLCSTGFSVQWLLLLP